MVFEGPRHFAIAIATETQRSACQNFLDRHHTEACIMTSPKSLKLKEEYAHLFAQSEFIASFDKENRLIGCLQLTPGMLVREFSTFNTPFAISDLTESILPRTSIITRYAIDPAYRLAQIGLGLLNNAYTICLQQGNVVLIIADHARHYPFYRRLGFKPLSQIQNSIFGYTLPLFLLPHDYSQLKIQKSPFFRSARRLDFPNEVEGLNWFYQNFENVGLVDPSVEPITYEDNEHYHSLLTQGLSRVGLTKVLKNASHIQCQHGDRIISQGQADSTIGFVIHGAVEIRQQQHVIAILGEGDIFGELAFILNIPRVADVIAATPNTEVALLNLAASESLLSEKDKSLLWQNLAKCLAGRFVK